MLLFEYNFIMKIIRVILAILIIFSATLTLGGGWKKINQTNQLSISAEYKGIITLWQVDSFEGGKGSRKQFLLKMARDFEKQNQGVLVMVINHTISSAQQAFNDGEYPDLISFGNGLDVENLHNIMVDRALSNGKIGDKIYATAWCRGGYVLIKNPQAKDLSQNTIIVSQAEYTQPLIALVLEGIEFDKVQTYKPMDAYVKFTEGKITHFLGTQRDVVRLQNRGMSVECTPITEFNDLYQYVALTSTEQNKIVYAKRFIDYLLSNKVQQSLNQICMLSPYERVEFDNEHLEQMQRYNDFKSISPFTLSKKLKEMQSLSISAINGDKNALNKIKNIII